ncbi:MAG: alpha/beta hydrolase [Proteobacteria bacterium]|nr:alpha/beta hydrolase [Pseudomonadota bacterium]
MTTGQVGIDWRGRSVDIEYEWVGPAGYAVPTVVFLHEGLGSVAMWKDFPQRFCDAAGLRGLVYSRPGYGRSTPRAPDDHWAPDFMHRQADEVLPALLAALDVDQPPWLLGHSDGGSIALLRAAHAPEAVAGLVVMAPHILVEDLSVDNIAKARDAYRDTDLRDRLARYHDDVDSAFRGWNDIWLAPAFRDWSIEHELAAIRCPVLAIQGIDDEYGTLEQIRGIARRVPQTRLLELADCGHSPHRDRPDAVIEAAAAFIAR